MADRPTMAALGEVLHTVVRMLKVMVVGAGDSQHPAPWTAAVANVAALVPGCDDATLTNDLLSIDPVQPQAHASPLDEDLGVGGKESVVAGLVRRRVGPSGTGHRLSVRHGPATGAGRPFERWSGSTQSR